MVCNNMQKALKGFEGEKKVTKIKVTRLEIILSG